MREGMTGAAPDGPAGGPDARRELLRLCLAGDAGAWRALYDEHAERVWRFVARMGIGPADVEDVTQEVFVVVHRRLREFDGRVALSTWILGIALRLAQNHRRRQWRQSVGRLLGFGGESGSPDDPERALAVREAAGEADAILARMTGKQRAVFVLYEIEGLDGPAIATIVGAPVHTVWSRLRLGRAEFSRLLRQRRAVMGEPT